ncbi:hypothetical protein DRI50_12370 [candidate division KSB1 bacterium]|nr:MAG: hypothetical protein DRI50_12370 [candidate division KSB1 bacterium]
MKKVVLTLTALFLIASLAMAGQPKLVKATITPNKAAIGEKVQVEVEFSGKQSALKQVYLVVRGYEYDTDAIVLKPVEGSKKNVWTSEQVIPYEAPAETFHLDINAIDKKGKEIITKGFENNSTGKAGSIELTVTY